MEKNTQFLFQDKRIEMSIAVIWINAAFIGWTSNRCLPTSHKLTQFVSKLFFILLWILYWKLRSVVPNLGLNKFSLSCCKNKTKCLHTERCLAQIDKVFLSIPSKDEIQVLTSKNISILHHTVWNVTYTLQIKFLYV